MAVRIFAAIDVGPFKLELGVYEMTYETGIQRTDYIRHVIVLGKDTYSTGKVSYESVEKTRQVLGEFVQIMKSYKVKDYRAYVTNVMKEAYNCQIILDQVRVRTGSTMRIISNPEQWFISYKAVAAKAAEFSRIIQRGVVTVDVGFGSAQPSLFNKDSLMTTQNLPLGILRIKGLLARMSATVEEHKQCIEEIVDNELFTFREMYLEDKEITNFIGTGEDILYIINGLDLNTYGDKVDTATMSHFYERMCQITADQIEERFGVNSGYASLLLPSVVVYKRILELIGAEMFRVSGIHLCNGITVEYASENKLAKFNHSFESDISATSKNIAKCYKYHTGHSQVLEQYVLRVFDNMKKFHGLGQRERLMLQTTVPLHVRGKFISIKDSNKCSYNIIMSTEIISLSYLEREITVNMVRYSIRDFDYDKVQLETQVYQEENIGMSRNATTILIAKLTAALCLVSSMDRSHRGKLVDCRTAIRENELVITTGYPGNMALEIVSFEQKADSFEGIFGIRPIFRQKRRTQM